MAGWSTAKKVRSLEFSSTPNWRYTGSICFLVFFHISCTFDIFPKPFVLSQPARTKNHQQTFSTLAILRETCASKFDHLHICWTPCSVSRRVKWYHVCHHITLATLKKHSYGDSKIMTKLKFFLRQTSQKDLSSKKSEKTQCHFSSLHQPPMRPEASLAPTAILHSLHGLHCRYWSGTWWKSPMVHCLKQFLIYPENAVPMLQPEVKMVLVAPSHCPWFLTGLTTILP